MSIIAKAGYKHLSSRVGLSKIAFNVSRSSTALTNQSSLFGKIQHHRIGDNMRHFSTKGIDTFGDGPHDFGHILHDERFDRNKPTIAYAKSMPTEFSAMRHEQILQLCVEGSYQARREALIRNVMAVDSLNYDDAGKIVNEIQESNRRSMVVEYLPYHVGFGGALLGGAISFPLIFDLNTVKAFNDKYVTMDMPPPDDLETFLEVGSWSWGWMEPVIGQVSFVLLILQFARNQMINLGIKPYGDLMLSCRANKLVSRYPQYDAVFVQWFSEAESIYGSRMSK